VGTRDLALPKPVPQFPLERGLTGKNLRLTPGRRLSSRTIKGRKNVKKRKKRGVPKKTVWPLPGRLATGDHEKKKETRLKAKK